MQVDVSKLQVYQYNLFLMFKHNLFLCLFNHLDYNKWFFDRTILWFVFYVILHCNILFDMRRKHIIFLLWCLWACSLIVATICVNKYINNKRIKLHDEFWDKFENEFEGQDYYQWDDMVNGYFEELFSGKPVCNYKRIEKNTEEWENNYGNVDSLYELNWNDACPHENNEGWSIMRTHYNHDPNNVLQVNTIFPYRVGLKNTDEVNPYSIEDAVKETFDFYTRDEQSELYGRFSNYHYLWPTIYACCNRYYRVIKNKDYDFIGNEKIGGFLSEEREKLNSEKNLYEFGVFQNDSYIVFIAATQETHYMIQEDEGKIREDKTGLLLLFGVGLSLLFFSAIIPLTKKEKKSKAKV